MCTEVLVKSLNNSAIGNNSLALPSTERSNIVSTTGRQDVYLQRQQYRPPMLPYNRPLPHTAFMLLGLIQ
jgi:hypothetical protein